MTQISYFCCNKAEKAARFDLQQTMHSLDNACFPSVVTDNTLFQRLKIEVLMNVGIFRWEFGISAQSQQHQQ